MREQDVECIAAEVLAALREGAPAGADRPVGHGETGTGVVPSAGRGGKPEAAHTGMPTAQDEGRDGAVRSPIWRGRNSAGVFHRFTPPRDVIDDFVSHTGARIATGTVGTRPRRGPTCVSLRIMPARRGRSLKKYLKNGSAGMASGAFPRWRRTRIPTSRGPTSGGCCPRSRCGS